MSRLIVVCGLGGTGKTTLADALAREINVACLHKDTIKATLHDQLGIVTDRSFLVFAAMVEEQLALGVDLIVEATFHVEGSAARIEGWRTRYGLDVLCVVLEASVSERRHRLATRTRHPVHAHADAAQLQGLGREAVDYAGLPGRTLVLDTGRPLAETLADVTAALKSGPEA